MIDKTMGKNLLIAAALSCFPFSLSAQEQKKPEKSPTKHQEKAVTTSTQAYMAKKLAASQQLLAALAYRDFTALAKNAEDLAMIAKAASWHLVDNEEFLRESRNFQDAVENILKQSQNKSLEGVTLGYVRLTFSCIHCHESIRDRPPVFPKP